MELYAVYLAVGCVAGVLAGLFGVGGGTIIVPALLLCFQVQGVPLSVQTHLAIGTSLATIVLTSISSTLAHHKAGAVRWPLVGWLTPGIALGVWVGAYFAAMLSGAQLQQFFGIFALFVAVQMWFNWQPKGKTQVPGPVGLSTAGGVIGLASAFFGIGGGSLTVPFLSFVKVKMQEAVATAAACGFPIALIGALGYLYNGWQHTDLPEHSTGFIYLPALIGIGITSLFCAKYGAKLAHKLSPAHLKKAFAVFLVVIGMMLLLGVNH